MPLRQPRFRREARSDADRRTTAFMIGRPRLAPSVFALPTPIAGGRSLLVLRPVWMVPLPGSARSLLRSAGRRTARDPFADIPIVPKQIDHRAAARSDSPHGRARAWIRCTTRLRRIRSQPLPVARRSRADPRAPPGRITALAKVIKRPFAQGCQLVSTLLAPLLVADRMPSACRGAGRLSDTPR